MDSLYACKVCLSSRSFEVPSLARQVRAQEVVTRWRDWLVSCAEEVSDTSPTATHTGEVRGTQQSGKELRPAASSGEARPLPPADQDGGRPYGLDGGRAGGGSAWARRAKASSLRQEQPGGLASLRSLETRPP